MNANKFLLSTVAAVTVASAIGLAYAQSSNSNLPAGSPQTQTAPTGQPASGSNMQNQRQPAAPGSMTTDSSSANTGANTDAMKSGTQTRTTTGQTPSSDSSMQNQRQPAAPGSMTTDSSGSANAAVVSDGSNVGRNTGRNGERTARPDRN